MREIELGLAKFSYESGVLHGKTAEKILGLECGRMIGDLGKDHSLVVWFREKMKDQLDGYRRAAAQLLPEMTEVQRENLICLDMGRIVPVWLATLRIIDTAFGRSSLWREDGGVMAVPVLDDAHRGETRYGRFGVERIALMFPSWLTGGEPGRVPGRSRVFSWGETAVYADGERDFQKLVETDRGVGGGLNALMELAEDDSRLKSTHKSAHGKNIPRGLSEFVAGLESVVLTGEDGFLDVGLDPLGSSFLQMPVGVWDRGELNSNQIVGHFFSQMVYLRAKMDAMRRGGLARLLPASHVVSAHAARAALAYMEESNEVKELARMGARRIDGKSWYDYWEHICYSYRQLSERGFFQQGMSAMRLVWEGYEDFSVPEREMRTMYEAWAGVLGRMLLTRGWERKRL